MKKVISLFLAFLMTFASFSYGFTVKVSASDGLEELAVWTIENEEQKKSGKFADSLTDIKILKSDGTDKTSIKYSGSGKNIGSSDWHVGEGFYFSTPTTGYENITISGAVRASSTGPGSVQIQYNKDGVWVDCGEPISIGNSSDTITKNFSGILCSEAANQSNANFRIVVDKNVALNGGNIQSGGTLYIAGGITISGTATGEDQPPETILSIEKARKLSIGTSCTVSGVVTFVDGKNVYIQDDTAGINVYFNASVTLKPGDKIKVTGQLDVYKGLLELKNVDASNPKQFQLISSGNSLPIAKKITIAELMADNGDNASEKYESTLVRLYGLTLGAINKTDNTPVTQGSDSINIYKLNIDGFKQGDVVNLTALVGDFNGYQLRVLSMEKVPDDPVTEEMISAENAVALKDINKEEHNGKSVTVVGQLVYRFGKNDNLNSAILEDVYGGEIYGLQIYGDPLTSYTLGDIVAITGTISEYGSILEMTNITNVKKVKSYDGTMIPAQKYNTIRELLADKDDLISEWVMLPQVTLGTYSTGTTNIKDSQGGSIGIYQSASYPVGTSAGDTVDLYACMSRYNSTYQLRVGSSSDFVIGEDKVSPQIVFPDSFVDAKVGKDYTVAVSASDNVGITSIKLTYKISGTTYGPVDMTLNTTSGKYQAVIPGNEIVSGSKTIEITVTAEDAAGNTSSKDGVITVDDSPRVISVTPDSGSETGDNKRPTITVTFENAGSSPKVTIAIDSSSPVIAQVSGNKAEYIPLSDLTDGKHTITAVIEREDGASTTYSWSFIVGKAEYELYFGQLHSHTAEYSDGTGTLEDAYDYVLSLPDSENVDFLAVTDHSNYFDSASNLGNINDRNSGNGKFAEAKKTTEEYNAKTDDKVFIYGYEMTWSGGPGHMNTFNTVGFVSRNNPTLNNKTNDAGLQAYYDILTTVPQSISQFNHPGTTFGTFADFNYWTPERDAQINLLEVGNGEGPIGSSSYWRSYEYYQVALDKGWHVAPTNNQDNHKGKWGNANTGRTVIYTDDFSEQGLYEAMRERSVYATEDKNLEINYTLNGYKLGTILDTTPDKVNIKASINDEDNEALGTVYVIVNGGVSVWSKEYTENSAEIDITLPCDYTYYYLKIVEGDGDIAVTAPIWTGDVLKVGISSVKSDAVIPVVGEEMTITTTLFNYEVLPVKINSMEYTLTIGQNTENLEKVTNLKNLEASSTGDYTIKFTPSRIGKQTITVTVNAELNGVPYVFTSSLGLDVLSPNELVNVAIDAGHKNFYVSGNYAGSDSAFIELCAKNGIRVSYINAGEMTYENLKKYKMVLITVPFISYGTSVSGYTFTDDELAALKKYAENGGNIILCGKSDRGNPSAPDEHADVIMNKILEAIGSDTKFTESIVVDNDRKANEAYRIYYTDASCFNSDNSFVSLAIQNANNGYSAYNAGAIIPGKSASVAIKGYDTTWATKYEGVFTDSKYEPDYSKDPVVVKKGDVALMTSENLSGGGWLLTASTAFFSTFEVKTEIDNSTTLQYANYWIVMDIINKLKPEPVITPISSVHEAGEGVKFTVEGIVTSNASGYDKDTAFFDCIYIQDATGGINLFPVDGNFKIGDVVRVTGVTGSYNGERELVVSSIEKIGEADPVQPIELSAKDAMSGKYLGQLIKVSGTVYSLNYATDGTLETIMIKDSAGDLARVFIDGYIMSDYRGLDNIKVGDNITAIGIGSITVDTESADGGYVPRLRVRDRSEIVYSTPGEEEPETPGEEPSTPGEEEPTTPGGENPKTGDNGMNAGMAMLFMLSAAGIILIRKRDAGKNLQ